MTVGELIERLRELDPDAQARISTRVCDVEVTWPVDHVEGDGIRDGGGHHFVLIHGIAR